MRIYATIGNYYGTPYVEMNPDGSYVFGLEDCSGDNETPITAEFFLAFQEQFGDMPPVSG